MSNIYKIELLFIINENTFADVEGFDGSIWSRTGMGGGKSCDAWLPHRPRLGSPEHEDRQLRIGKVSSRARIDWELMECEMKRMQMTMTMKMMMVVPRVMKTISMLESKAYECIVACGSDSCAYSDYHTDRDGCRVADDWWPPQIDFPRNICRFLHLCMEREKSQ